VSRIGLTGGLAAGKSTVADMLRAVGINVIDSDGLVAELYAPGQAGALEIQRLFGDSMLNADGRVDHRAVAQLVFADEAARERLEQAVHPLVRQEFARRAENAEGLVVLEAPVLAEAGFADDFDVVISVEADPELRVRRAVSRGMTELDARGRIAAQNEVARLAITTHVIRNDGSLAELQDQVSTLIEQLRD